MQAGDLRARVGFYRREVQSDGYGNNQASYGASAEFTVAANIKPRLGGEQVLAGRLTGQNLVNITVRKSADTSSVTDDWRAKDERTGTIYNIRSIIDPEQETSQHGRWLEMLCEEGVAT